MEPLNSIGTNGRLMMNQRLTQVPAEQAEPAEMTSDRRWLGRIAIVCLLLFIGGLVWRGWVQEQENRPRREIFEFIDKRGGAFIFINRMGDVVDWTPAAERLTGYDHDEAVGRQLGFILPPNVREQHHGQFTKFVDAWPTDDLHFNCAIIDKEGRDIPVKVTVFEVEKGRRFAALILKKKG